MTTRTLHMCLSVRGALRCDKRRQKSLASLFIVDGKQLRGADELREFLMDCLAAGKEVLPMGDCEGFDFKTGCPGHETP